MPVKIRSGLVSLLLFCLLGLGPPVARATGVHAQTSPAAPLATATAAPVDAGPVDAAPSDIAPAPVKAAAHGVQIVGGQVAEPGEWPWQALLYIGDSYLCSGSLLNEEWIVTAAHCLTDPEGDADAAPFAAEEIDVVLGEHALDRAEGTEQQHSVAELIIHPDYDERTHDSDIALLRLTRDAELNQRVQTVVLLLPAEEPELLAEGAETVATGWGATEEGGEVSPLLREVSLPIVSRERCREQPDRPLFITENMLCAGYPEGGRDACQGDSGGPLVAWDADAGTAGAWKLAGLVSFGDGCARPNSPGVYTRVPSFVQWIRGYVDDVTATPTPLPSATPTPLPTISATPTAAAPSATPTFTPTTASTLTPTVTSTGHLHRYPHRTPGVTPSVTPTVIPPITNAVVNGGFEAGDADIWTERSSNFGDDGALIYAEADLPAAIAPRTGAYVAWLGGADDEISELSQTTRVPAVAPRLIFYYQIVSNDSCGRDYAAVLINGAVAASINLCAEAQTDAWTPFTVPLDAVADQTTTVAFRVETDGSLASSFFVDDVLVRGAAPVATAEPTDPPTATPTAQPPASTPPPTAQPLPAPPANAPGQIFLPLVGA